MNAGNAKPSLDEIREDLRSLAENDVVLHGSYLSEAFTRRSDVDVAVLTRETDRDVNRAIWRDLLGTIPDRYDVRVFELLPLDVQHDIAERHEVIFGDPVDISYYLYRIHRLWDDVGPRIEANRFETMRERMRLMGEG